MAEIGYVEIAAPQVVRRVFADFVCGEAARELGIAAPRVRFFAAGIAPPDWDHRTWTDERQLHGEFRAAAPSEIWVRHNLPRDQMAQAVAHEVHHAAWHVAYGSPSESDRTYLAERAADEAAAERFASHFVRRLKRS